MFQPFFESLIALKIGFHWKSQTFDITRQLTTHKTSSYTYKTELLAYIED